MNLACFVASSMPDVAWLSVTIRGREVAESGGFCCVGLLFLLHGFWSQVGLQMHVRVTVFFGTGRGKGVGGCSSGATYDAWRA